MDIITTKNISKSYKDKTILQNISISFESGYSYVIVGRNGAGKSTFLSILSGILKPDTGIIETKSKIGFIPQQDILFEELTTKDNINFWLKASKNNWESISPFLNMFGIDIKKKIKNLSGGMKKSVAICCGLIGNPDIIIMDEPFSGLDAVYKNSLLKSMEELKNQGKTLIYTSHNIDEIVGLHSHIYNLKDATIVYKGESEKIKDIESLLDIFGV